MVYINNIGFTRSHLCYGSGKSKEHANSNMPSFPNSVDLVPFQGIGLKRLIPESRLHKRMDMASSRARTWPSDSLSPAKVGNRFRCSEIV